MKKQTPNPSAPKQKTSERYIFSCVANILYIAPAAMCLAFGVMTEGFSPAFLTAFLTVVLAIPVAFTGLYCYKQRKRRTLVLALAAVQLVMHVVSAVLITTWYLILAPGFILTLILVANAKAIEDH